MTSLGKIGRRWHEDIINTLLQSVMSARYRCNVCCLRLEIERFAFGTSEPQISGVREIFVKESLPGMIIYVGSMRHSFLIKVLQQCGKKF
jgi:hypothetical protein